MQTIVQELVGVSKLNVLKLNGETLMSGSPFCRRFNTNAIPNMFDSGEKIEIVNKFKLLGIIIKSDLKIEAVNEFELLCTIITLREWVIRSDLSCSSHANYLVFKASKHNRAYVV